MMSRTRALDEPRMTVCTCNIIFHPLIQESNESFITCIEPNVHVVALNSNFGHKTYEGYTLLNKDPKLEHNIAKKKKKKSVGNKQQRCKQGDGSSFNSATEANIRLVVNGKAKIYHLKMFIATGSTQVAGCRNPDMSDAYEVLRIWKNYLNDQLRDVLSAPLQEYTPLKYNMINHKFCINYMNSGQILDLINFAKILESKTDEQDDQYKILDVQSQTGLFKLTFGISVVSADGEESNRITVNMFSSGKINTLGSKAFGHSDFVYRFIDNILLEHDENGYLVRDCGANVDTSEQQDEEDDEYEPY